MSEVRMVIRLDNAAFEGDDCGPEVARIMTAAAEDIRYCTRKGLPNAGSFRLRDINGNTVGEIDFEMDEEEDK